MNTPNLIIRRLLCLAGFFLIGPALSARSGLREFADAYCFDCHDSATHKAGLDLEKLDRPSVEINVSAEHAPDFVATTESSSVVAALDLTLDKVEQQIRKHKERVTDHKGGPNAHHT